jgi:hypothetical protein
MGVKANGLFQVILRAESNMDEQNAQDKTYPSLHPVHPVHPCSNSSLFNLDYEPPAIPVEMDHLPE